MERLKNSQNVTMNISRREKTIFIKAFHVLFIQGLYIRNILSQSFNSTEKV